MRHLRGTKDYMLTFKRSDNLKVIGYTNSDFVGCVDSRKSTFGYVICWLGQQFHGKVLNKLLLLHPQWKLNLWYALRPQFMVYGCEILSQGLLLSTLLRSR